MPSAQQGRWRRPLMAMLLAAICGWVAPLAADQPSDSRAARAELEKAQADIERLKDMLQGLRQEVSGMEAELKESETDIGRLQRERRELEQQIRDGESRLIDLREQTRTLQASLKAQQQQIARQVRAAYMAGQQSYLKLLLNQDDPGRMARMLRYYDYVGQARVGEITRFNDTIAELQQASAQIVTQQTSLQQQREGLAERTAALETQQRKRSQLLASLQGQQRSQAEQLRAREAERAELTRLIKRLEEAVVSIPVPAGNLPFAQARGKMPLPVRGQVAARFGSQRGADSRLKWDGLVINAPSGTPVNAIHGGRVVFADWLRGSGLLLILDHGGGYLTLYGHNQTLLKEVGAWVQPGEPIATVGSSGGLSEPSLYFAIRHRGQALDPLGWCMLSG
ncbi:peptidoglycan DD-metalloendopeptidase family protein [Halopseudomonas aestusnigri]|jgi:septal ring factor EnvC (AmiA/AmiB activator)|uniref:murein hydrolase activator EnvC family protein n=1 Tax=Halopseudomonas aestusnigri TaxID=857252 RepID=UPI001E5DC2BD|nr:peptidoglycan DD-metalloendopeptidase family protein [Halopseudomonas aestusnigri]MCK5532780.1 peptidoglycan DD-metalloendopeptidase family protein [Halopseudomonas aestusnigri]UGV30905.1 peptidoglycan DD-metalloendopeptidase family protein [Halopseudomonas aestusnigri]|tara:strand:- start:3473 stop:4657 length:1185 start_codon:yes stop_codon:yes gene_type:complete